MRRILFGKLSKMLSHSLLAQTRPDIQRPASKPLIDIGKKIRHRQTDLAEHLLLLPISIGNKRHDASFPRWAALFFLLALDKFLILVRIEQRFILI